MARGFVVALVGAESTGKTSLSLALAAQLRAEGHDVVVVDESLRSFCDRHQRTPRQDEQQGLAHEQQRRIREAAARHALVLADTSGLMTAVYSDTVFGDTSLYPEAEQAHARDCDLSLLTALDLPWQADGLQRDGPQVREPVDQRLRAALQRSGVAYAVVAGQGPQRVAAAHQAIVHALAAAAQPLDAPRPRWHWVCERCDNGDCERHLLPR